MYKELMLLIIHFFKMRFAPSGGGSHPEVLSWTPCGVDLRTFWVLSGCFGSVLRLVTRAGFVVSLYVLYTFV